MEKIIEGGSTPQNLKLSTAEAIVKNQLRLNFSVVENATVIEKPETSSSVSCSICGKLVSKNYLRKHMHLHSEVKPHRCDLCTKSFVKRAELKLH